MGKEKEKILLVELSGVHTQFQNPYWDNLFLGYYSGNHMYVEQNDVALWPKPNEKDENAQKELYYFIQLLFDFDWNIATKINEIWIMSVNEKLLIKKLLKTSKLKKLDDFPRDPKLIDLIGNAKVIDVNIPRAELIRTCSNKEIFLSSDFIGEKIISLADKLENFKILAQGHTNNENYIQQPRSFIQITNELNHFKEELAGQLEFEKRIPTDFPRWRENSLLKIMDDKLYNELSLENSNPQLLYIVGESKILFDELVDILFKQEKDFHYQYEWDRIAKKFSTKCNKLLLINLEEINILKLNEIKDRILSWLNNKKKQIVILKGSRRGYELFRKLNFSLIELPTLGGSIKRVTQIFFNLLDRNKKTHYIENDNIIGHYNLLENLLKDFSSVDQMNELIFQEQFYLSMEPVSWYNFLAGISSYETEVQESSCYF